MIDVGKTVAWLERGDFRFGGDHEGFDRCALGHRTCRGTDLEMSFLLRAVNRSGIQVLLRHLQTQVCARIYQATCRGGDPVRELRARNPLPTSH